MSITIFKESIGNQADLKLATTAALRTCPLGHRIRVYDDTKELEQEFIYLYASSGQATQYVPYVIAYGYTTGTEVQTKTPVAPSASTGTLAFNGTVCEICVPQITATSGLYFWAQTKGTATVAVTASSAAIAAGKEVGIIAGTSVVVFTSTTGNATNTQVSANFGIVKTAAATSAAVTAVVNLYGGSHVITT